MNAGSLRCIESAHGARLAPWTPGPEVRRTVAMKRGTSGKSFRCRATAGPLDGEKLAEGVLWAFFIEARERSLQPSQTPNAADPKARQPRRHAAQWPM